MGTLRNKMILAMKVSRFSPRTQQSYLAAVTGLANYYHTPPDQLDFDKIKAYLLHLTVERGLSWSTCNVAVSAFRFFYSEVLRWERVNLPIPPRKKPTTLPEVLSREQLHRLFACAHPPRNRVLLESFSFQAAPPLWPRRLLFRACLRLCVTRSGWSRPARPLSSPEKVLDYLGRYTHRVAICNNRILSVEDSAEGGRVTFSYRDRKNGNQTRTMTLEASEFIRRFLLRVLPDGLMRIRHYGLLANRSKNQKLARCRELLGNGQQPSRDGKKSARQIMLEVTGLDLALCPACGVGRLVIVGELPAMDSS